MLLKLTTLRALSNTGESAAPPLTYTTTAPIISTQPPPISPPGNATNIEIAQPEIFDIEANTQLSRQSIKKRKGRVIPLLVTMLLTMVAVVLIFRVVAGFNAGDKQEKSKITGV
ncbi:hypothetical protein LTR56_014683 [Elasticomyces elasticus]|nr:hypothetical protein LTR56_014683 [Elasticomyces elasticus]KAK3636802.1 hypothetical protein LTR22_018555 [Elasticomyces elasticus]KAK4912506.1 hypothetical protein LTR49_019050 [Elasticomyces elasticus]KAK5751872.1 hypothetical protein LTS12_018050 [Elasticomyces elasticus]